MKRYISLFFGILILANISISLSSCSIKESEEYIDAFRASESTFGIFPIVTEKDVSAEFTLGNETYRVAPVSIVDERHLISIKEERIDKGRHGIQMCILLQLDKKGTAIMADYTKEHYDERVAIMINDTLIVAPVIKATITTGHIRSTVNRDDGQSVTRLLNIEEFLD